jgi:pyruvate kinase
VSYLKLHDTVKIGSRILLDDGIVEVEVVSKGDQHGEVTCRVRNQGMLGNKKGAPFPYPCCIGNVML